MIDKTHEQYFSKNINKIKSPFRGIELIERNYSQMWQDMFVLTALGGKTNSTFLELGAYHPINISNTFLLESLFGWSGTSIDIVDTYNFANSRPNTKFILSDALNVDYRNILKTNRIDYLSLDLDPPLITLNALDKIPFDTVRFSVITYETDEYRMPSETVLKSRNILERFGYERVCSSLCNIDDSLPQEEWYIDPTCDIPIKKNLEHLFANTDALAWKKFINK